MVPFLTDTPKSRQPPSSKLKCTNSNTANVLQTYITVKTSWLFQLQSGYPGCRQTGDTVIMRGLLWYLRLIAKGNSRAAAQFILQPQYAENPYNICGSLTWLQVPYCNFEVHL